MKKCTFLLILILCSCNESSKTPDKKADPKKSIQSKPEKQTDESNPDVKVEKYVFESKTIRGDFDGNGTKENLKQVVYSNKMKIVIDSIQIKQNNDIDAYFAYIDGYKFETQLKADVPNIPSLNKKHTTGLYFLINLGDLNGDRKDEIALTWQGYDYSASNTCEIYSNIDNSWQIVFEFQIHADVFRFKKGKKPPQYLKNIPGVLEQKNGIWQYYDYLNMEYDRPEDVGKMLPLKLNSFKVK